ncbi:hypothetical protein HOK51_00915 [Candidatus Woesearchaeota archaeon]|jgi:hypothetical protein|nr:hypothetical protein [Candidatus Woesearchaeota archaeon]MBT6518376.1 hypothetical protein [Candidatus Woesearchaeota archaeon]MBT7368737.1 hypothetical protein [Candidatus Woesearchaeota archaeon]
MASKRGVKRIPTEVINLEVEKSRLNREKSMLVMNKSLILYFCFMFVAVLGFVNGYISKNLLNVLIVMGLAVLIVGAVPYVKTMHTEETRLNKLIDKMMRY